MNLSIDVHMFTFVSSIISNLCIHFSYKYHQSYPSMYLQTLLDGYDELFSLVQQPQDNNLMLLSMQVLEQEGVLTPRSLVEEGGLTPLDQERPHSSTGHKESLSQTGGLLRPHTSAGVVSFSETISTHAIPCIISHTNGNKGSIHSNSKINSNNSRIISRSNSGLNNKKDVESLDKRKGSLQKNATADTDDHHDDHIDDHNDEHHDDRSTKRQSSSPIDIKFDDLSVVDSYSINSPRAIFLAGCLQSKIPPITIALLRKRISSSINLAHMGIGNNIYSLTIFMHH